MNELHVVLGAGQVGPFVAESLVAMGKRVRIVRKTQGPSALSGVEQVSIDVRDADAVARVTAGATSVYHCVNPLYFEWPELLVPMARGIVEGTARSGARLVVLDNLYMYGDTSHMHEGSPNNPRSKKGALRVEAANVMLEADRRGDLKVAIGRAADFFGPRATLGTIFGDRFYRRVLSGKPGESFGDPDMLHSYAYTPDVATALVALGTSPDTRGIYMLPVQPAESTRQVIGRFYRALGKDLGVGRLPTWVLRALGVFNPLVREVVEMIYQWEQPYVLDDTRIRTELGVMPTPWDEAIATTLAWAKRTYTPALAA